MKTLHTIYNNFAKHNVARLLTIFILLLTVGIGDAFGATVTFTFSEIASANSWTNGTAYTTVTISPITINAIGGGNNGKYYTSDATWRMYDKGSVSITAADGYTITAVSSNPSKTFTITEGVASLSLSATTKFKSITVTYTAASSDPYTVTFDAGSGTCGTESLTEISGGAGVTLPTANPPATCATNGWKFAGWWTGSVAETTTSPGELLAADSNYKPASDCTLYAVYSHTEAGGGGSGFYLSVTKDATTYYIGEKGSGSFLSAVTDINSAATFNIESNQYLYYGNKTYVSSTANSTSLTIATTTPTVTWDITDEGETITFKSNGTGGRYLAFNYNNGSPRFSSYGSTYTYELTKHTTSTTTYNSNPVCGSTPTLTVDKPSLAFGNVATDFNKEMTFTLSGSNLTADATLALSGTNAGLFSVSPTSVTPSNGSITSRIITVTYTPTAKASHSAILTISSTGAESIEIQLSGTGVAQMADYTVKHYQQNIDGTYPTTPTATETLSGEVGTEVTPAVKSYTGFDAPSTKTVTIAADGSTVVEYKYERNSYTLTWDVNEGNNLTGEYTSGSVKFGATITKPDDPTRENHNFKGWKDQNGSTVVASTMPADNLTYTAQWKETYTVTFLNHGEEVEEVTVEAGDLVTLPTEELTSCDTEKYPHFYGWTANPIDGVGTTEPADLITANFTPNNSVTLHAVFVDQLPQAGGWQVVTSASELVAGKIYTIGSYGSPDSGVAMGTQNTNNRGTASWTTGTPVELTLGGSTGEWTLYDAAYNNGAGGYLYAASSSSNHLKTQTTLNNNGKWDITFSSKKAKIVAQGNYTRNIIRYNDSGLFSCYASGQDDIQLLTKSMATEPSAYITSCCETPAPTNGTYTNVTGSGSSMSVKLTWEDAANAGSYHITGEKLADDVDVTYYTVSGLIECETYIFYVSAYPEGGCESPKLAIEVTPYIPKTVTFVDGSTTTQKTTSCDSKTVTVPNASKECYTSIWTDENGNEYSNGQTITPTENMILTAQYTIIEYEITFKDYDGTVLQTYTINCGTIPTPPADPTREADKYYEYEFAGWTPTIKEADGNQTYTATYTQTQHPITITWMVNNEAYTVGEPSTTVLAGEKVAKLPTPPNPDDYCGQVFAGWTDEPIDEVNDNIPSILFTTPDASPTIYKEDDNATITFYAVFANIVE